MMYLTFVFAITAAVASQLAASAPLTETLTSSSSDNDSNGSNHSIGTNTVSTTSGHLMGLHVLKGNSSVYQFLSVPYAQAPIGPRRFQRPEKLSSQQQNEALDTTEFGPTCIQYRHISNLINPLLNVDELHEISEDCLKLHVYVPAHALDNKQTRLPVIVWIPGEGFDFADARQFDATHLAAHTNSIVISVQYRVGVFGFLHEPSIGAMGNQGIHDQVAALEWIQENAAAFGGDSNKVTIMGRFSGSMSISSLITAPKLASKALFSKAILMSGIAVNEWTIDRRPEEKLASLKSSLSDASLCRGQELSACLMQIPAKALLQASSYEWRPIVDDELISDEPVKALANNHKLSAGLDSVMLGSNQNEGLLCLYRHLLSDKSPYSSIIEHDQVSKQDLVDMIRDDANIYFKLNLNESGPVDTMFDALLAFNDIGMGQDNNNDDTDDSNNSSRDLYMNACTMYMIKSHTESFKRNIMRRNKANRSNVGERPVKMYEYELKYKPSFSNAPEFIKTASHGDDVLLMLGLAYNTQASHQDLAVTRNMMGYLKSFVHNNVRHGNILVSSSFEDDDTVDNESPMVAVTSDKFWPADGPAFVFERPDQFNVATVAQRLTKANRMYDETMKDSDAISINAREQRKTKETNLDLLAEQQPFKVIVIESASLSNMSNIFSGKSILQSSAPQSSNASSSECDQRDSIVQLFMIMMLFLGLGSLTMALCSMYINSQKIPRVRIDSGSSTISIEQDQRQQRSHFVPNIITTSDSSLKASRSSDMVA